MKGDGTNPHASEGTGDDSKYRTDVTGSVSSEIGKHFAPMIHSAPIHGMSTSHERIACPLCGVGILWDRAPVSFTCQGCSGVIDGSSLSV